MKTLKQFFGSWVRKRWFNGDKKPKIIKGKADQMNFTTGLGHPSEDTAEMEGGGHLENTASKEL